LQRDLFVEAQAFGIERVGLFLTCLRFLVESVIESAIETENVLVGLDARSDFLFRCFL
jgi:hypothetical protein